MDEEEARERVNNYRRRLSGDFEDPPEVPLEADRQHILKTIDNMRLMQSKNGAFRRRDVTQITRQMAIHAPWPTIDDFRDNDEAVDAGVETDADVKDLIEDQGLLGSVLKYRATAEAIVRWIHSTYPNEHTNQDCRNALRSFVQYRLKLNETPEHLEWIPTTTSNDHDPVPSARDLLRWKQDVVPMIEAARNPRDKALFAVQFEAGCRSGELRDLRVRDVFDTELSVGLHVDGKQGERTVHLHTSIRYLQRWLSEHPGGGDDYLWSKLTEAERPSYNTWLSYFKDAADRAGVSKEATPTNFRKSNTRWLVQQGLEQARIEERQGRKRGSKHTRRYLARFGAESNERRYLEMHGEDVETEESEEMGPIECPRCGEKTPREGDRCMNCGMALSEDVAREAKQKHRESLEALQQLQQLESVDSSSVVDVLDDLVSSRVQAAIKEQHS